MNLKNDTVVPRQFPAQSQPQQVSMLRLFFIQALGLQHRTVCDQFACVSRLSFELINGRAAVHPQAVLMSF